MDNTRKLFTRRDGSKSVEIRVSGLEPLTADVQSSLIKLAYNTYVRPTDLAQIWSIEKIDGQDYIVAMESGLALNNDYSVKHSSDEILILKDGSPIASVRVNDSDQIAPLTETLREVSAKYRFLPPTLFVEAMTKEYQLVKYADDMTAMQKFLETPGTPELKEQLKKTASSLISSQIADLKSKLNGVYSSVTEEGKSKYAESAKILDVGFPTLVTKVQEFIGSLKDGVPTKQWFKVDLNNESAVRTIIDASFPDPKNLLAGAGIQDAIQRYLSAPQAQGGMSLFGFGLVYWIISPGKAQTQKVKKEKTKSLRTRQEISDAAKKTRQEAEAAKLLAKEDKILKTLYSKTYSLVLKNDPEEQADLKSGVSASIARLSKVANYQLDPAALDPIITAFVSDPENATLRTLVDALQAEFEKQQVYEDGLLTYYVEIIRNGLSSAFEQGTSKFFVKTGIDSLSESLYGELFFTMARQGLATKEVINKDKAGNDIKETVYWEVLSAEDIKKVFSKIPGLTIEVLKDLVTFYSEKFIQSNTDRDTAMFELMSEFNLTDANSVRGLLSALVELQKVWNTKADQRFDEAIGVIDPEKAKTLEADTLTANVIRQSVLGEFYSDMIKFASQQNKVDYEQVITKIVKDYMRQNGIKHLDSGDPAWPKIHEQLVKGIWDNPENKDLVKAAFQHTLMTAFAAPAYARAALGFQRRTPGKHTNVIETPPAVLRADFGSDAQKEYAELRKRMTDAGIALPEFVDHEEAFNELDAQSRDVIKYMVKQDPKKADAFIKEIRTRVQKEQELLRAAGDKVPKQNVLKISDFIKSNLDSFLQETTKGLAQPLATMAKSGAGIFQKLAQFLMAKGKKKEYRHIDKLPLFFRDASLQGMVMALMDVLTDPAVPEESLLDACLNVMAAQPPEQLEILKTKWGADPEDIGRLLVQLRLGVRRLRGASATALASATLGTMLNQSQAYEANSALYPAGSGVWAFSFLEDQGYNVNFSAKYGMRDVYMATPASPESYSEKTVPTAVVRKTYNFAGFPWYIMDNILEGNILELADVKNIVAELNSYIKEYGTEVLRVSNSLTALYWKIFTAIEAKLGDSNKITTYYNQVFLKEMEGYHQSGVIDDGAMRNFKDDAKRVSVLAKNPDTLKDFLWDLADKLTKKVLFNAISSEESGAESLGFAPRRRAELRRHIETQLLRLGIAQQRADTSKQAAAYGVASMTESAGSGLDLILMGAQALDELESRKVKAAAITKLVTGVDLQHKELGEQIMNKLDSVKEAADKEERLMLSTKPALLNLKSIGITQEIFGRMPGNFMSFVKSATEQSLAALLYLGEQSHIKGTKITQINLKTRARLNKMVKEQGEFMRGPKGQMVYVNAVADALAFWKKQDETRMADLDAKLSAAQAKNNTTEVQRLTQTKQLHDTELARYNEYMNTLSAIRDLDGRVQAETNLKQKDILQKQLQDTIKKVDWTNLPSDVALPRHIETPEALPAQIEPLRQDESKDATLAKLRAMGKLIALDTKTLEAISDVWGRIHTIRGAIKEDERQITKQIDINPTDAALLDATALKSSSAKRAAYVRLATPTYVVSDTMIGTLYDELKEKKSDPASANTDWEILSNVLKVRVKSKSAPVDPAAAAQAAKIFIGALIDTKFSDPKQLKQYFSADISTVFKLLGLAPMNINRVLGPAIDEYNMRKFELESPEELKNIYATNSEASFLRDSWTRVIQKAVRTPDNAKLFQPVWKAINSLRGKAGVPVIEEEMGRSWRDVEESTKTKFAWVLANPKERKSVTVPFTVPLNVIQEHLPTLDKRASGQIMPEDFDMAIIAANDLLDSFGVAGATGKATGAYVRELLSSGYFPNSLERLALDITEDIFPTFAAQMNSDAYAKAMPASAEERDRGGRDISPTDFQDAFSQQKCTLIGLLLEMYYKYSELMIDEGKPEAEAKAEIQKILADGLPASPASGFIQNMVNKYVFQSTGLADKLEQIRQTSLRTYEEIPKEFKEKFPGFTSPTTPPAAPKPAAGPTANSVVYRNMTKQADLSTNLQAEFGALNKSLSELSALYKEYNAILDQLDQE